MLCFLMKTGDITTNATIGGLIGAFDYIIVDSSIVTDRINAC